MFSHRTDWPLGESPWALAAEKARRNHAVDLTESNPTRCGFQFIKTTLLDPLSLPANLVYEPDSCGLESAREAVSAYYQSKNVSVPVSQIVLTAGTSEAYSFLLKLLVNPGETVLVPEPGYPLLDHVAGLSDAKLVRYPLVYKEGWSIDREKLKALMSPDVKAIVVVHPNNPTGHCANRSDRQWLEEAAAANGTVLISDEVFLDFVFDDKAPAETFAWNRKALTFTLSGISKVLGLPQMKLSWMGVTGPEEEVKEAIARLTVITDAFLTVSGPPQRALPYWLSRRAEAVAEIGGRIRQNRRALLKAFLGLPAEILKADGGWCSLIRFEGPKTDEAISLELVSKGVLVQPGYLFDLPEYHLVVSLLPPSPVFNQGLSMLAGYLGYPPLPAKQ